jgi:hypothetical protein
MGGNKKIQPLWLDFFNKEHERFTTYEQYKLVR